MLTLLGDKKLSLQQLAQMDKSLPSVPPSLQYTTMTGRLTIAIKVDYINLPFQKFFEFRYSLWGSTEKYYFLLNTNKSQLKITASMDMLSRYFWDMNILCIEVVSTMQSHTQQDPTHTNKIRSPSSLKSPRHYNMSTQEKKIVGYIYIPLRKYFINHTMSSFSSQKFAIIDQNKKRIGQVGVDFVIDMLESNGVVGLKNYLNQTKNSNNALLNEHSQRKNTRLYSHEKHQVSILDKNSVAANRFSYQQTETFSRPNNQKKVTITNKENNNNNNKIQQQQQQTKSKQQERSSKKNYFSHKQMNFQQDQQQDKKIINQGEQQSMQVQMQRHNNNQIYHLADVNDRKQLKYNKNNLSSKEDISKKAQHTDLSLIRMKWGANHPTVQLMKLRLDQAKYLDARSSTTDSYKRVLDQQQQQQPQINRVNIYLKQFTLLLAKSITQIKYLSLSYLDKDSKPIFKTQINLQTLSKNLQKISTTSIDLNHLIVLNCIKMTDKLIIQTVDSFAEIPIKQLLMNSKIIDLRRRDNKKRVYELRYEIGLYESNNNNQQKSYQPQHQIDSIIQPIKILNNNNKNKSIIKSIEKQKSMIINDRNNNSKTKQSINRIINDNSNKPILNKSKPNINQILPQKQNGQIAPQQQLKSPYHKLIANTQPNNIYENINKNQQNINKNQQNIKINYQKLLSSTFSYFQLLDNSEDQSCFRMVNKLLNQNKQVSQQNVNKLLYQLEVLLVKNIKQKESSIIQSLSQIIRNLFMSNFASFYKCFQSYKEINQRYQNVLYKLKKILYLSSSQQNSISRKRETNILSKILAVLDYVKKHKKDKITFGLVKVDDLFQIIREKLLVTSKKDIQIYINNSQNSQKQQPQIIKFIQSLLSLYTRHQQNYIKISQIQSDLEDFLKSKGNQKVQISSQMNMNLGFLLNLHEQVTKTDDEDYQKHYRETVLYYFIEDNIIKEYPNWLNKTNNRSQGQPQHNRISLYELLFSDPLNLSDIQSSSINFSSNNIKTQQQEYHLITQQQDNRDYQRERFRTEDNNRVVGQCSKLATKQQQLQQIFYKKQQGGRLMTQQIYRGGDYNNRLNTQDENVIELMNYHKKGGRSNIKPTLTKQNNQQNNDNDNELIKVQVTKKEQFHHLLQQQQKPQQNINQNNISQNNNNIIKDDLIISSLHQKQQQLLQKAKTKYISVKCTLIDPTSIYRRDNKLFTIKQNNQSQFIINLFYRHYLNKDKVNQKQKVEQFKLEARKVGAVAKCVLNSFQLVQQQQMTPVQQYTFRVELNHHNQISSKKSLQSFKNNINDQIIIKAKNHIGKQQYPIQDSQGKILHIIEIEIEQVDQYQQRRFQEQKQIQLLASNNNDQQKHSGKFNRMLILNVNKLFCLNSMQKTNCLRLIYQTQNEIQLIKDIQIQSQDNKIFALSTNQRFNKEEQNIQTKVLQLNIDFIKIKNHHNYSSKKHILKIFNVKKSQQLQKGNKNLSQNPTVIKSKPPNKLGSRTSQPVSRFLDDDKMQNTFSQIKNVPLDFICQFQFTFNSNSSSNSGISRHNKWLIDGPYRLQIDLYDVRYEKWNDQQQNYNQNKAMINLDKLQLWQKKIEKILIVFKIQNQQKVRQKIRNFRKNQDQKENNSRYEDFLTIIAEVMGYRLTEKQIFGNLCFPSSIEGDYQQKQKLSLYQKYNYLSSLFSINHSDFNKFDENKKSNITSLKALYQEFETFDLEHEGLLTMVKFEVLKKILPELIFLSLQNFTVNLSKNQQILGINDFKINERQTKKILVDYLKILWECRKSYEQNFFFETKSLKRQISKTQEKPVKQNILPSITNKKNPDKKLPQYYRIAIRQFRNLMFNNIPCTLQFRISNKKLFQPIHRCYSYQFSQNNWSAVKYNNQREETFTLEVFNRTVSISNKRMRQDLYEYKMLEKFDLRKILQSLYENKTHQNTMQFQLKCQNLDGSIFTCIQYLDSKQQYQYCLKQQNVKNNVNFSSQDEQIEMKKLQKEEKSNFFKKQIDSNLKRQFYEDQQSQNQKSNQREIDNQRNNKSKFIGESVMKVFIEESNKKDLSKFQQKLKLQRDQTLLSQTRKQWQTMLSKNIEQDEFNEQEKNRMKQSLLQQVLKKSINKEEINRKFQLFKGDGISDSSQDEIESG